MERVWLYIFQVGATRVPSLMDIDKVFGSVALNSVDSVVRDGLRFFMTKHASFYLN